LTHYEYQHKHNEHPKHFCHPYFIRPNKIREAHSGKTQANKGYNSCIYEKLYSGQIIIYILIAVQTGPLRYCCISTPSKTNKQEYADQYD
jgi:hypothetical protein